MEGCRKIHLRSDIDQPAEDLGGIKVALAEFCKDAVDRHIRFRQLSNIRQCRNEEIQSYIESKVMCP